MTSPLDHVLFHLRDALATDPRVGELGLEVTCDGDRTVVVRGMVSTEQRRSHIFVVAAEVLRVHRVEFDVRNDTEVTMVDASHHEPERL